MQALFKIMQNEMPLPHNISQVVHSFSTLIYVSQELHEFLSLCFIKNPEKRPSAATLLLHPWISNKDQHNLHVNHYFKIT